MKDLHWERDGHDRYRADEENRVGGFLMVRDRLLWKLYRDGIYVGSGTQDGVMKMAEELRTKRETV